MVDTDGFDGFLSRWSRRKVQVKQGVPTDVGAEAAATVARPAVVVATPVPAALAVADCAAADLAVAEAVPPSESASASESVSASASASASPPPPTLEEAQRLTPADDFSRFVRRDVDPQVKNTALRTLFSDPHFNVMDGLDTYIDDYGKPDPLPPGMLRQMVQSAMLGLFDDEPKDNPAEALPGAQPALPLAALPTALPAAPPAMPPDLLPAGPAACLPARSLACSPATPPDEDTALRLQPHDAARPASDRPGAVEDPGGQL